MKKPSSSSSPLGDLTNSLTPFSTLRRLCKVPKIPPNLTPIRRKENRVSNSVSGSSIGSSHNVADPRLVAPPPTPPLGETGSGEHSYNRRPSDVTPTRLTLPKTSKDKGKAIAVTPIRPASQKTLHNKGIVIVSPSDETRNKDREISSATNKLKVRDTEIPKPSVTFSSSHLTRDNDKWKASPRKSRYGIIQNDIKGKVKKTAAPCDGLSLEMKHKDALPTPLNLSSKKADHKGKSLAMPSGCQPPFKFNEDLVEEVEIYTCPPLPRTRSGRKRKAEDGVLPKSWTDVPPKKPKMRRVKKEADDLDFLPKDFVDKYNAYFKEVDEFELQEEEVSGNGSD